MDSVPEKTLSVNEIWPGLFARSRQRICNRLAQYDGSNADGHFEELVRGEGERESMLYFRAGVKKLELEDNVRVVATTKRNRDDGDVADDAPAMKKPRLSEATAPLQAEDIDIASPKIPFNWPGFRQTSIKFGQPTLSAAIRDKIPTAEPSSLATPFGSSRDSQNSDTGFSTVSKPGLFSSSYPFFSFGFGNAKANSPPQQESECDEQFTFADRRSPQPYASHQSNPSAQGISPEQHSSAPSSNSPPQGANVSPTVTAVNKPPFAGVDMSSLKIPANSNVSVTLNVFQAPSSLHQSTDSDPARKLKCIQCNAFYMEAQNGVLACRRHTGMNSDYRHMFSLRTC